MEQGNTGDGFSCGRSGEVCETTMPSYYTSLSIFRIHFMHLLILKSSFYVRGLSLLHCLNFQKNISADCRCWQQPLVLCIVSSNGLHTLHSHESLMRIANKTGKQQMEISSQISPHHLIGMHRCAGKQNSLWKVLCWCFYWLWGRTHQWSFERYASQSSLLMNCTQWYLFAHAACIF